MLRAGFKTVLNSAQQLLGSVLNFIELKGYFMLMPKFKIMLKVDPMLPMLAVLDE